MKKLSKKAKANLILAGIGTAVGVVGTIIGVKCIANGKYENTGNTPINLKDGTKVTVYDSDVARIIQNHTRAIDRLNYKKMIDATLVAQDIISKGIEPKNKKWIFDFKHHNFRFD